MGVNYNEMIPFILGKEGLFQNDKEDNGNAGVGTMRGVTWGTYKQYARELLGVAPTETGLKSLTESDAGKFIKKFGQLSGADKINNTGLANYVLDFFWGSGYDAIKVLQRILNTHFNQNLTIDGINGQKTQTAINASDANKILDKLHESRVAFYKRHVELHPEKKKYLRGWLSRARQSYGKSLQNIALGLGFFMSAALLCYAAFESLKSIKSWL